MCASSGKRVGNIIELWTYADRYAPSAYFLQVRYASQRPWLLGNLFGQFGEDDGARGSCGYLEYYLVVTRCGVLVLTFAARDVSEEVVDFVTKGLGGNKQRAGLEGLAWYLWYQY